MKKKKYDKTAYNNEYKRKNYSRINIICKPEKAQIIAEKAQDFGMNKSQFLLACAAYIIDNNIDLSESESDAEEL